MRLLTSPVLVPTKSSLCFVRVSNLTPDVLAQRTTYLSCNTETSNYFRPGKLPETDFDGNFLRFHTASVV
jgi:hypothetical protein